MSTGLGDLAAVHHEYLVGVPDGGEPVGDGEGGAVGDQVAEVVLDDGLGLVVDVAGRLVEDEHLRVAQDGAGERDALALPARELDAALADHGLVAVVEVGDELDKSRSLLHYHYDTREDLLLAFVDNLVGWTDARLDETDTTDPRAQLLEFVDHFTIDPDDDEHRDFVVALFELRMQAVHNEAFREKLARHYCKNVETAASIVAEGVETGVFRPVDPSDTAEAIYNAIEGARFYQVVLGADGAARRMQDALVEHVVSDLVAVPEVLSTEFGPAER